jgi:hypothetical protein
MTSVGSAELPRQQERPRSTYLGDLGSSLHTLAAAIDAGMHSRFAPCVKPPGRRLVARVIALHAPRPQWPVDRQVDSVWLPKCRGILLRHDKKDGDSLGLNQLACALYCGASRGPHGPESRTDARSSNPSCATRMTSVMIVTRPTGLRFLT